MPQIAPDPRLGSVTGVVFNVQRFSIHDGPGIRTTVFLKGCPLKCAWCHNPEGISRQPELLFKAERCIGCGHCGRVCIQNASDERATPGQCTHCGECAGACAAEALQLVGTTRTMSDLMAELERDRPFFDQSGGGVTFSGGEPLMQSEFLRACLTHCRELGIHTAVDTSGFAARDIFLNVARLADLILYDLKCLDDHIHREYTGVPVQPILDNLRAIDGRGADIWIRAPLIAGINDADEHIDALGEFVASLEHRHPIYLIAYHRFGTHKPAANSLCRGLPPQVRHHCKDELGKFAQRLAKRDLAVYIKGQN